MKAQLRRLRLTAFAALLLAASAGQAAAQVRLTVRWLYPVETVYISNFTPNNTGAHPDLLGITLVNGAPGTQSVVLELAVRMERPTATEIFRGTTDPFALSGSVRQLTNRDLVQAGKDTEIQDYSVGAGAESMEDRILQTGKLPAGSYVFAVTVSTPQGIQLDRGEVNVELTNPTRIELLSPGRPSTEAPPVEASPSPRFLWSTDGAAPGAQYRVKVARADGAASAEEAILSNASWEEVTQTTSATYPASAAALRLEPGMTYAWQVTREVRTSGGVERIESPIYWFRAGGTAQRSATASADDATALRMQRMLQTLGLGAELVGFRPVGQITVDGRTMPLEALEELLAAIAAGQLPLISVRVR